jgi:hypothetical protein
MELAILSLPYMPWDLDRLFPKKNQRKSLLKDMGVFYASNSTLASPINPYLLFPSLEDLSSDRGVDQEEWKCRQALAYFLNFHFLGKHSELGRKFKGGVNLLTKAEWRSGQVPQWKPAANKVVAHYDFPIVKLDSLTLYQSSIYEDEPSDASMPISPQYYTFEGRGDVLWEIDLHKFDSDAYVRGDKAWRDIFRRHFAGRLKREGIEIMASHSLLPGLLHRQVLATEGRETSLVSNSIGNFANYLIKRRNHSVS